jgi:hypothetical protein
MQLFHELNKVKINLNMISASMKHWIYRQIRCIRLSHKRQCFSCNLTPSSLRSASTQIISVVAFANALYFAYVLEQETVIYFLALQEIKLGPKNIAKPLVKYLPSRQQAQCASEKAL